MFAPEVPQITWPPTSDARPPMKRLQHGRGQWLRSDQHKSHWSPESSTFSNRRLIPWCHLVTVIVSQVLLRIGEATKGPAKTWISGPGNRTKKDGTCRCWYWKDPSSDIANPYTFGCSCCARRGHRHPSRGTGPRATATRRQKTFMFQWVPSISIPALLSCSIPFGFWLVLVTNFGIIHIHLYLNYLLALQSFSI